jgi:hypothetical protein
MKPISLTIIGGFVLTIALVAFAGPDEHDKAMHGKHAKMKQMHKHGAKFLMERVDKDGDGKVTKSEYMAHSEERFNQMDIDGDGVVTSAEMNKAGKEMREMHRERMHQFRQKMRDSRRGEMEKHRDEMDKINEEMEQTREEVRQLREQMNLESSS